jgi:uncharacterized protein
MHQALVLERAANFAKEAVSGNDPGHDFSHCCRVLNTSEHIGRCEENVDMFVVRLAAILHDVSDWKFSNDHEKNVVKSWLEKEAVSPEITAHVCRIIQDLSFRGAKVDTGMNTLEGMIVQDADRLDAMGAIGIARAFSYGGHARQEMYRPDSLPVLHESFEQYKNSRSTTINHFYEKLLLLKDRMNTSTAKLLAEERHVFMEQYLQQFFKEWA